MKSGASPTASTPTRPSCAGQATWAGGASPARGRGSHRSDLRRCARPCTRSSRGRWTSTTSRGSWPSRSGGAARRPRPQPAADGEGFPLFTDQGCGRKPQRLPRCSTPSGSAGCCSLLPVKSSTKRRRFFRRPTPGSGDAGSGDGRGCSGSGASWYSRAHSPATVELLPQQAADGSVSPASPDVPMDLSNRSFGRLTGVRGGDVRRADGACVGRGLRA